MKNPILKLLTFLIATRISLFILPFFALIILFPERPSLSFLEFLNNWNRWDAPHYLYIAEHGYTNVGDEANFIVFLPLYPILISLVNFILNNFLFTSIVLSNIFFVLGSFVFYQLLKLDSKEVKAKKIVYLLSIFPTAYFFSAPYAESLFFLFVVSVLYFARKENFIAAGLVAGLAAFTRPFGVFIALLLVLEFLKSKRKTLLDLIMIFLPTFVFLAIYLYINYALFGNLLAFQKILLNNWYKHFSFPWTGIISSWRLAVSSPINHYTLMVGWAEALTGTASLALIPFAFLKQRRSYAVYYTIAVFLFTSTSFILSSPRYLLSLPPFFILLYFAVGSKRIWQFISMGLLFYLTFIFTSGQWAF